MDNPIIPELQIRSKNRIKTSVNAPELDDTNVPVTKTSHSIPNNGEAKNHGEELFSVPISYSTSEKQIQTLGPCPCDQRKNTPPKPTWTRLLHTPASARMDISVGQKIVGAKRQYDSNDHGDRLQTEVASKRFMTVEDSLQTTVPNSRG